MSRRYYQPGAQRAQRVRDLFGSIAARYDVINDAQSLGLHRAWKRRLVRRLAVGSRDVALDLCCGTGDISFRLRRAGARVVGLDFSLPMLRVAQQRTRQARAGTRDDSLLLWVAGDGMRLPVADRAADVVTLAYGLRNLSDFDAALREVWRVTRPGGRLGVLDFGKPSWAPWRAVYFGYLRFVVPCYGRVLCGDTEAYRYILDSLRHFPDQAGMARMIEASGWRDVEVESLGGGMMGLWVAHKPR